MGLAKRVFDPETKKHIPYRNDKSLTGTARYASIHAHLGEELSRRDDLEAIGYVLIYFLKGSLPWQNIHSVSRTEKHRMIKQKKVEMKHETLCEGCPYEIYLYMKYCRDLEFTQEPDYQYLNSLITSMAAQEGINLYNKRFDWSIKAVAL